MIKKTKPKPKPVSKSRSYMDMPLPQFYTGSFLPNFNQVTANPINQSSWFSNSNPKIGGWGSKNTTGVLSGLAGNLGNIAGTDWDNGESVANTTESLVETILPMIPVVGTIASAINQFTGPIGEAVTNSDPTSAVAVSLGQTIDPIGSLAKGVGEISEGKWGQGLMDMVVPWAGGIHQASVNKTAEDEQNLQNRTKVNNNAIRNNQLQNTGLIGTQVAAFGGKISSKSKSVYGLGDSVSTINKYSFGGPIREFKTGGTHGENPYGGIPVDSNANPSAMSGKKAVATVEEGEFAVSNFIFTNRF